MHAGRRSAVAAIAPLVVLLAACAAPVSSPAAPQEPGPSPRVIPSGTPPAEEPGGSEEPSAIGGDIPATGALEGFDEAFARGVEAARAHSIDGGAWPVIASPECRASARDLASSEADLRICMALSNAPDPAVTIIAISAGSLSTAKAMFVVGDSSGDASLALPSPSIGDETMLARTWGDRGCFAWLSARSGTLVAAVAVRLEAGSHVADCGVAVPVDDLAGIVGEVVAALQPYRTIGLVVDDPAGRDRVVQMIESGTLVPGERDIVKLPADLADVSDTGEVVALRDGRRWTIVFFELRGVVDSYRGWVYRTSGRLGPHEDPLGGNGTVRRIGPRWFRIEAN